MHLNLYSSLFTLLSDPWPAKEILNALNALNLGAILEAIQNGHKVSLQHSMRLCLLFAVIWNQNVKVVCSNCLSHPLLAPRTVPVVCQKNCSRTPPSVDLWKLYLTYTRFIASVIRVLQQHFWYSVEFHRHANTSPTHPLVVKWSARLTNLHSTALDKTKIAVKYGTTISAG